ncbi:hypothetical protein F5B20DRAFT_585541 [Whalleya microplaca]|nr:hypothetical protein F5B20DRAFT_585541 [Whalleya microplaca]
MATRTVHDKPQPEPGFYFKNSKGNTLRGPQEDKSDNKDESDVKKPSDPKQTDTSICNVKTDGQNDGDDNNIDQEGEGNRGKNRGQRNKIRQNIPPPPPGLGYMKWIGAYAIALGVLVVWARWILK